MLAVGVNRTIFATVHPLRDAIDLILPITGANNVNKYLPIALIIIGLVVGILGFSKFDDSGASLSVGDLEVSATDEGGRAQSYVMIGLGAVSLLAGIAMMAKSKS